MQGIKDVDVVGTVVVVVVAVVVVVFVVVALVVVVVVVVAVVVVVVVVDVDRDVVGGVGGSISVLSGAKNRMFFCELGVVCNRRHGLMGRGQGFCDWRTNPLILKSVTMGRRGSKIVKIL